MIKGFQSHFKDVALLVELYLLYLKLFDLYPAKPQVSYPTERQTSSSRSNFIYKPWAKLGNRKAWIFSIDKQIFAI